MGKSTRSTKILTELYALSLGHASIITTTEMSGMELPIPVKGLFKDELYATETNGCNHLSKSQWNLLRSGALQTYIHITLQGPITNSRE